MKAFTLLEVLVAGAIAFLILFLTVQFVIPAMKLSQRTQGRTQMQQGAYTALQKIAQDLQESNAAGLSFRAPDLVSNVTILVTHPLSAQLLEGRPVYLPRLISYTLASSGSLQRKIWQPPPSGLTLQADQGRRLDASELLNLAAATGEYESRQVCRDVYEMSISSSVPPPNWGNPLRLRLALRQGQDSFVLEQVRWLRNSP